MSTGSDAAVETFPDFAEQVSTPATRLPAGTWDTCAHVYGDLYRYPFRDGPKPFLPPTNATLERLQALHDQLDIDRGVLVQGTTYGSDHRAMLDALDVAGDRYVGVALLDASMSEADIAGMHERCVRGARFTLVPWVREAVPIDELNRQMQRVTDLGWCAAVHVDADVLIAQERELDSVEAVTCIDHMGHLVPGTEEYAAAFDVVRRLLEKPNWWIRLSNPDRSSALDAGFTDMADKMREIYELAPERTVWGMDWPHVFYRKPQIVDDGQLVDLVAQVLTTEDERRQVLVENPKRLYRTD